MKKIGGYQILDITKIPLKLEDSPITIEDGEILSTLKEYFLPYILDDHLALKPFYLRTYDDDLKTNAVFFCEVRRNLRSDKSFAINGILLQKLVTINITLSEIDDDYGVVIDWGVTAVISVRDSLDDYITVDGSKIYLEQSTEIFGDLDATGDVTAKTLKQTLANYLFTFELNPSDTTNFEKIGTQYCRIEEVNGEIHIILCAMFKNIDSASHGVSFGAQTIDIPEEIAEKIYDLEGKKVSENIGIIFPAGATIRCGYCGYQSDLASGLLSLKIAHSNVNRIQIVPTGTANVGANGVVALTAEFNLSLM